MRLIAFSFFAIVIFFSVTPAYQDGEGRSTKVEKVGPRVSPPAGPVRPPTKGPISTNKGPRSTSSGSGKTWPPRTPRPKPKPGSPQAKAEDFLSRGKAHYDDAANDEAIVDFGRAIESVPTFAEAFYCRALAFRRKGDTDSAISDYSNAIKYDPEYTEAYFNRADAYISKLNFEAAVNDLTIAINLHPNGIAIIDTGKGNTYVNKMEVDEDVYLQNNGLARIYTLRALTFDLMGNSRAALSDLETAMSADPELPAPYFQRGRIFLELRDFDAAIRDCQKAIELEPSYSNAVKCRADASDAKLKSAARLIGATNRLTANPEDAAAFLDRANIYLEGGQLANAIADYDKVIELKPTLTIGYFNRAWAHFKNGATERSLADLSAAISLDPKFPDAYCRRGQIYEAAGDLDAAIAQYNKALEINPRFGDGYLKRGTALIAKGSLEAALADLTTYIEKHNQINSTAYRLRAVIYDKMNRSDLADAERRIAKLKMGIL